MSKFMGGIEHYLALLSLNSQRQYRSIVKEWLLFCGSDEKAFVTNEGNIWAFIHEQGKHIGQVSRLDGSDLLSWGTIQRKLIILKALYDHLMAVHLVTENPFNSPQFIKKRAIKPKRPTEAIDFDMVKPLIDIPGTLTKSAIRDSCFLALIFAAGLRRSEVTKLKISDIFYTKSKTIFLRLQNQKNGKVSNQVLPDFAVPYLERYLAIRQKEAKKHDYLITHYYGEDELAENKLVGDKALYRWFKKHARLIGLPATITPHSARATSITKLLKDGLNYREVQEFSRHASIQMVELYDKRFYDEDLSPSKKLEFK